MVELRDAVAEVRRALLNLHLALVGVERREYERLSGRLPDTAFLEQLIDDPDLRWLAALTTLIVRLDEIEAEEDRQQARALYRSCPGQIRKLLTTEGSEFHRRYQRIMQQSPDVVVAHAALRGALETAESAEPSE